MDGGNRLILIVALVVAIYGIVLWWYRDRLPRKSLLGSSPKAMWMVVMSAALALGNAGLAIGSADLGWFYAIVAVFWGGAFVRLVTVRRAHANGRTGRSL
jgi:hypothetical protein